MFPKRHRATYIPVEVHWVSFRPGGQASRLVPSMGDWAHATQRMQRAASFWRDARRFASGMPF